MQVLSIAFSGILINVCICEITQVHNYHSCERGAGFCFLSVILNVVSSSLFQWFFLNLWFCSNTYLWQTCCLGLFSGTLAQGVSSAWRQPSPTRLVLEEVNSARLAASALARQGRKEKQESTGARRSGQLHPIFSCQTKGLIRCHRKLSWEELAVELSIGGRFAVDASNVVVFLRKAFIRSADR